MIIRMKDKIKGLMVGVLITSLCFCSVNSFATRVSKSIEVIYNGIKVVVDGQLITFGKDLEGNFVEPFIYNGTTYLPVRSVGEALGKTVNWDNITQTVYIGVNSYETNYMTDILEPYKNNYTDIYNSKGSESFDVAGTKYYNGFLMGGNTDDYVLYNLNGEYSEITGVLGISSWIADNQSRPFNIYIDGVLYKSIELIPGNLPQEINIPVSGALQLKFESPYGGISRVNTDTYIGFGNVSIK